MCDLLSSCLLTRNFKIKIYKTIILPLVLFGCETWSLILSGKRRFRAFEKRMPKRIFGPKGRKWRGAGEDCIMSNFAARMIKSRRMSWVGHVARMGSVMLS
jgi:hypothetical protein